MMVSALSGLNELDLSITCQKLLSYGPVSNVLFMANTEFEDVRKPDLEFIQNSLSKIIFYYGYNDHWAPRQHHTDMISRFPSGMEINILSYLFFSFTVFKSLFQSFHL